MRATKHCHRRNATREAFFTKLRYKKSMLSFHILHICSLSCEEPTRLANDNREGPRTRCRGKPIIDRMRRGCMWRSNTILVVAVVLLQLLVAEPISADVAGAAVTRDDFPAGFIFGAGTSAYQAEGAAAEEGRKPSIWDTFTHAGRIVDNSTADITADQYHKYKEDVKLMHEMGLDAYRFSISWSRLIPDGRGPVNPKGLEYYNNLINELLSYGIEPHVTLHHFDLPQALEDEYEGLLSPRIVEDFTAYADICFREFGDRVKYWITFNEPNIESFLGYSTGMFAPGRCSHPYGNCSKGDSTREPFMYAHNVLLSHASAAALYKEKYQAEQGGRVGITILAVWFEPFTDSPKDVDIANKLKEFHIGWFLDPLAYGTYPAFMKEYLGSRLPSFGEEESKQLRASFDFVGINHYYAVQLPDLSNISDVNERSRYGNFSAEIPSSTGLLGKHTLDQVLAARGVLENPIAPWALQKLLEYIKEKYGNPPVMIHENGYGEFNIDPANSGNSTDDDRRTYYLQEYTGSLLQSIRNGSNTLGYFVWSFIDCFELNTGYTSRYGLYGVDFSRKDRRRYPRLSAQWYSNFLRSSTLRSTASSIAHAE
ncbi:beta-glucosidase 31-like isoform X1 [Iris pallida]|uniref:Beta-glucosidase 31-like isoform X1 n=1 Tax=Iris pallida TaxID=29817 RepID=A0AAX6DPW1_IRIPA|nr:beta-glucosidase 31-like isoform X1 [Iris pallida]